MSDQERLACFMSVIQLGALVFFMVVAWRFMRAHESIAEAMEDAARSLRDQARGPKQ